MSLVQDVATQPLCSAVLAGRPPIGCVRRDLVLYQMVVALEYLVARLALEVLTPCAAYPLCLAAPADPRLVSEIWSLRNLLLYILFLQGKEDRLT